MRTLPLPADPLQKARLAAVAFSVVTGAACLTQLDRTLPVSWLAVVVLAAALLVAEAVEAGVRGRMRWWSPVTTGPLLAVFSTGLTEKPATIAIALSALAARNLYGSSRAALVRTALVAAAIPVLVVFGDPFTHERKPVITAVVPTVVLVLFSTLVRLLYSALHLHIVTARRESLMAATSRALLEAGNVTAAEAVVRDMLAQLAGTTEGLRLHMVASGPEELAPDPATATVRTETHTLVLSGPAVRGTEIRSVVETVDAQLALVRANDLAHRELYAMAHHDLLTTLCNRRSFFSSLTNALDSGRHDPPAGVMLVDLDDFKQVNDTYGHAAGDAVLVQVARRISAAAGQRATVARLGGDEFAVLVPDVGAVELHALAEVIRDSILRPIPWSGADLRVGASIGTATAAPGHNASDVMRLADLAMYEAKARGKNLAVAHAEKPAAAP